MLEAEGECVSQPNFLKAIKTGVKQAQNIVAALRDLQAARGRPKRALTEQEQGNRELKEAIARSAGINMCIASAPMHVLKVLKKVLT